MKTSIFVPILIVVIALIALGVAVWQVIAPPPITATNQATQLPPVETPVTSKDVTPASAPEVPAIEPDATPTPSTVGAGEGKGDATAPVATGPTAYVSKECRVGGCSGVVCEDASAPTHMTTC